MYHRINLLTKNTLILRLIKLPLFIISNLGIYFIWNSFIFIFYIKNLKPTIVHINNGGFPASEVCNQLAIILKIFFPSVKIIYQVNSAPSTNSNIYVKKINGAVNYFITHSESNRSKLINIGMSAEKVKAFPSFFNDDFSDDLQLFDKSKFNIVSVGFLEKRKGHKLLIQALNHIKDLNSELYSQIHIHIIGSGEEYDNLVKCLMENKLESKVTLWGKRNDYLYFIKFCDVFVLPSIYDEDLPLVLLSAMKYSKKVISTKLAGIGEILNNRLDALLVDVTNNNISNNLGLAINEIYTNTELGKNLSVNIRKTYDLHFSELVYFNNINNLYIN